MVGGGGGSQALTSSLSSAAGGGAGSGHGAIATAAVVVGAGGKGGRARQQEEGGEEEEDEGMLDPANAHLAGVDGCVWGRFFFWKGVCVCVCVCAERRRPYIYMWMDGLPPTKNTHILNKNTNAKNTHVHAHRPMARNVPDLALFLDALVPRRTAEVGAFFICFFLWIFVCIYSVIILYVCMCAGAAADEGGG